MGPHKGTAAKNTQPNARYQTLQPQQGSRAQTFPLKQQHSVPLPSSLITPGATKKLRAPNAHGHSLSAYCLP